MPKINVKENETLGEVCKRNGIPLTENKIFVGCLWGNKETIGDSKKEDHLSLIIKDKSGECWKINVKDIDAKYDIVQSFDYWKLILKYPSLHNGEITKVTLYEPVFSEDEEQPTESILGENESLLVVKNVEIKTNDSGYVCINYFCIDIIIEWIPAKKTLNL